MAHPVLALGAALLTAAGYVWYVPALTDLRAGDDRPRPTRLAALACLTWWLSVAAGGLLLLAPVAWQVPAAVVLSGAVTGALLRSTAAADRRAEQCEAARCWELVQDDALPAAPRSRPRPAVLAWLAAGLAASVAIVASVLLSSHGAPADPALAVTACGSVGVGLFTVLMAVRRGRSCARAERIGHGAR